ncbi:hypothetical protein LTR67_010872 [Exophiala xenobiotica]|jgi:hypothetical protein
MYEHCVRYIAEAKLQVLREALLADRTQHDDKEKRVPAGSVPCRGHQSEPVRSGSFTVHIIETIDWNDEVDGGDDDEDSDVEDIEISSDDGWDELEGEKQRPNGVYLPCKEDEQLEPWAN